MIAPIFRVSLTSQASARHGTRTLWRPRISCLLTMCREGNRPAPLFWTSGVAGVSYPLHRCNIPRSLRPDLKVPHGHFCQYPERDHRLRRACLHEESRLCDRERKLAEWRMYQLLTRHDEHHSCPGAAGEAGSRRLCSPHLLGRTRPPESPRRDLPGLKVCFPHQHHVRLPQQRTRDPHRQCRSHDLLAKQQLAADPALRRAAQC